MKTTREIPTILNRLVVPASRALDIAVGVLLLVIVVIMLAQVVGRYALGSSLVWSEELTRLLHIWMVMLAAVKASHMRIDLLIRRMPDPLKLITRIFSMVLSSSLLVLMIIGGLNMIELTAYDKYTGLDVSVKYVYVALVFAALLWLPVLIGQAIFPKPESE